MLHWNVRKRHAGFSLVEMLATAVVLGVIAAVASPNLIGMYNRSKANEGQAQIEGAIKEAQRQAIRNGRTCKIILTTTTVDGQPRAAVQVLNNTYNRCLLSDRTLPSGVTTTDSISGTDKTQGTASPSTPASEITFSSKGNTDAASAGIIRITHNNASEEYCVEISGILGNIRSGNYDGTKCVIN